MNETLPVAAIKNGTVIDHIHAGQALRIIHLLSLQQGHHKVTIGLHLPSKRLGTKDLIKIESRILTGPESNEVVVFSPSATINVIRNFEVIDKISTRLPDNMKGVFICANPACITQVECVESHFLVREQGKNIKLICSFCDKVFDRNQLKVHI